MLLFDVALPLGQNHSNNMLCLASQCVRVLSVGADTGSTAGPGRPTQCGPACSDAKCRGPDRHTDLQCWGHGVPAELHKAGIRTPDRHKPHRPLLSVSAAGGKASSTGQTGLYPWLSEAVCLSVCMSVCECGRLPVTVCFCRVRVGHVFERNGHGFFAQHAVMHQCQGKKESIISHGDQLLCELRGNRDVL